MPNPLSGKPTFGAGRVFAIPNVTNPTPTRALVPQGQSIDVKRKVESLFGENIFAAAVGVGETEVTGKVEFGKTVASVLANLISGNGTTTGSYFEADNEAGTTLAASPYSYTAVNGATFLYDLGVVNATTGVIYSCVASGSEVAGKSYSVSALGVYKFALGDASTNVKVSYAYTVAASGVSITLSNQLQGSTGGFQAVHVLPWGTEQDMFVFYNCIASSFALSAKKSGFGGTTLDYTAAVNGNNQLGVATFAEAA